MNNRVKQSEDDTNQLGVNYAQQHNSEVNLIGYPKENNQGDPMTNVAYLAHLIRNLTEIETLRFTRAFEELTKDTPSIINSDFPIEAKRVGSSIDLERWISRYPDELVVIALLRVIDLSDETIAYLYASSLLSIRQKDFSHHWHFELTLTFSLFGNDLSLANFNPQHTPFLLKELTAASMALTRMCEAVDSANRPFGISSSTPIVEVKHGSVEFILLGQLMSAGLGAASLIAIASGAAVALKSIADWGQNLLNLGKTYTEMETAEINLKKANLELETARLQKEKAELETALLKREAASSLVPLSEVREVGERLGLDLAYTHHLVNRTLPTFSAVTNSFRKFDAKISKQEI